MLRCPTCDTWFAATGDYLANHECVSKILHAVARGERTPMDTLLDPSHPISQSEMADLRFTHPDLGIREVNPIYMKYLRDNRLSGSQ